MFKNGKDKLLGEFAAYLSLHVPPPVWHLHGYFEGRVRSLKPVNLPSCLSSSTYLCLSVTVLKRAKT